ncbi:MAG TPA: DMT family transporter, partial [Burkholderiales bacterium]|nr:DMT family transporter [Burkholderiales bacterium]
VPPLTLVAGRITIGALILLVLLYSKGLRLPAPGPIWAAYTVLGIVGNVLPFFLITWGQQSIDSALAGILMAAMPLATLLLAHFLVKGERVTWGRAGGFLLGFLGIVLLFEPAAIDRVGGSTLRVISQLSILCGALCYAANSVMARLLVRSDFLVAAAGTMLVSSTIAVPLALGLNAPWTLEPSASSIAAIVWLGVGPTAIATILYYRLIGSAGPTFMSLVNYLSPAIAVFLGVALLGEKPGVNAYAGLALILVGIAFSQWRRR